MRERRARSANGGERGVADAGRALVVHPIRLARSLDGRTPEAGLAEATGLAEAIDLKVVQAELVTLRQVRPSTLFGKGFVDRIAGDVATRGIGVAVMDGALTAVQQRNLERAWNCKVIDRTGLILEIFGERAHTREGRLQVELAHLTYQRSRLVRSWTHLERQRGGYGFLGGPGETQIEADRRQIDQRITQLRRELSSVARTRGLHREARRRVPCPIVALVGYTNAGKSTLFNRLTGASVDVHDMLFATLDPTMRRVRLPSGREAILSDTVGFVSELPTQLVAAFRATLEEVREADVIVHVRDISHPDRSAQLKDVLHVLHLLGIDEYVRDGIVEAWNKVDLLDERERRLVVNQASRTANAVPLSALRGEGCERLLELLDRRLSEGREVIDLEVTLDDGASIAWLYEHGEVLDRRDDGTVAYLRVGLDPATFARFRSRARARAHGATGTGARGS